MRAEVRDLPCETGQLTLPTIFLLLIISSLLHTNLTRLTAGSFYLTTMLITFINRLDCVDEQQKWPDDYELPEVWFLNGKRYERVTEFDNKNMGLGLVYKQAGS